MTLYTLDCAENTIQEYYRHGGEVVTVREGCLGLGLVICHGPGLKTTIIEEIFLNEWSSGHKIRSYNKTPKKYEKMLMEV